MTLVRTFFHKHLIIGLIIAFGGLWSIHSALTPLYLDIQCDQKIDPETRNAIRTLLGQHAGKRIGAQKILQELTPLFSVVRSVTIQTNSARKAIVAVQAHVPQVIIASLQSNNPEYALCKGLGKAKKDEKASDVTLIEKKYFSEAALHGLPVFLIDGAQYAEAVQHAELISCVTDLDPLLFDEYKVTWRAKSEIIMQSKALPCIIVADVASIHDKERLSAVKRIYEAEKEMYKNGIKADIRLRESIVCSQLDQPVEKFSL